MGKAPFRPTPQKSAVTLVEYDTKNASSEKQKLRNKHENKREICFSLGKEIDFKNREEIFIASTSQVHKRWLDYFLIKT